VLDEVGIMATDTGAIRRAGDFFRSSCTEPVRPEYLNACLKAYRPPIWFGQKERRVSGRPPRIRAAKLWLIVGIDFGEVPEGEKDKIQHLVNESQKHLLHSRGTSLYSVNNSFKPRYFNHLQKGDWVLLCIGDRGKKMRVFAPEQVLDLRSYRRKGNKRRYVLLAEQPGASEGVTIQQFRRMVRMVFPKLDTAIQRTTPVDNSEAADKALGFGTAAGPLPAGHNECNHS